MVLSSEVIVREILIGILEVRGVGIVLVVVFKARLKRSLKLVYFFFKLVTVLMGAGLSKIFLRF